MGLLDRLKKRKENDLPLIARVNLAELKQEREKNMQLGEVSILARADYTKRIPTIRLFYVALEAFLTDRTRIGQRYGISSPFRLPRNMTYEEAFKVISYLSNKVEKENDLEPACEKSVSMVSKLLTDYGFSRVESYEHGHYHAVSEFRPWHKLTAEPFPVCDKIDGVVDLFSVGGNFKLFKKSDLHDRYFEWYTKGVTAEEIVDIYKSHNLDYILEYNDIINKAN